MECVISIDLGTQSIRVAAYDLEGRLINLTHKTCKTYYPAPGMAEQDPEEWWSGVKSCIREIKSQCSSIRVMAVAVSATSSTVLAVDSAGNPLTRAIMWMDTRAALQAERITKMFHPVLSWCGGVVSAEWFLPKLLWIKEKQPEVYSKAYLFVEALDWLNYKLTGRWVCSQCTASCKWNYIPGEGWPNDFLIAIGLPELPEKVPRKILPVGEVIGEVKKEVALDFGWQGSIPVVQGGIDAHSSLVGTGSLKKGDIVLVLGSSSVLLMHTATSSPIQGFWGPYKEPLIKGLNLLEGGQTSSGSIVEWFVEKVAKHYSQEGREKGLAPFEVLDLEASRIGPGAGGIVVLDHWQGNRTPYKDPSSRGVIWGLTLYHDASQLGRAIYEGISFGIRLLLDRLREERIKFGKIKVCGGGAKSRLWLQILADVSEQSLEVTSENMTLLGNAIVAATGVGVFHSLEEGSSIMCPVFREIAPRTPFAAYESNYERYKKLYPLLKDLIC